MTTEATAPTLPFDPLSPPQKAPSASEVFRSRTQTAILQAVHTGHRGLYISELAERIGMAKSSIHHQVESLEAAGIVCSERIGRCRLISLNPDSPTAREISHLLDRFTGVESLLRAALRPVPGIERAFMPRTAPQGDGTPVVVVGDVDAHDVFEAIRQVGEVAGRSIDLIIEGTDQDSGVCHRHPPDCSAVELLAYARMTDRDAFS